MSPPEASGTWAGGKIRQDKQRSGRRQPRKQTGQTGEIMAGMFYSLQEVVAKLKKTEADVKQMVKDGKLREFRDGAKVLFKADEVDKLAEEHAPLDLSAAGEIAKADAAGTGDAEPDLTLDETDEIVLAADTDTGGSGVDDLEGLDLTNLGDVSKADTNVGTTGLSVLGETDDGYKLAGDTQGETVAEEEAGDIVGNLDDDMNLESVGSGSGLLDLSLQADDTSLGAVLDDILPTGSEDAGEGTPGDLVLAAEEGEAPAASGGAPAPMAAAPEEPIAIPPPGPRAVPMAFEPEPTAVDKACGISLFVPLLAIVLTATASVAALRGIRPSLVQMLQKDIVAGIPLVWVVAAVLAVVVLLMLAVGALTGSRKAAK